MRTRKLRSRGATSSPTATRVGSTLRQHGDFGRAKRCWRRSAPPWLLPSTTVAGVLALLWLALRTGPRPSRFAYPCQQAAFGTAAAAFGAPLVAAILSVRKRLFARMPPVPVAAIAGGVAAWMLLPVLLAAVDRSAEVILLDAPPDYRAEVYLVNEARGPEPGRHGGIDDLIALMDLNGLSWHRSSQPQPGAGPDGLIGNDDVVLIKVNAQWSERGGTNTDVLRGVIRQIVEHPDGFIGEIVVADNGQGWGSLDRPESNAEDHAQSVQDAVDEFVGEGWRVSTFRWDTIRDTEISEYSAGDMSDGYVIAPDRDPETEIKVSYAKFQTSFGTHLSYKFGVWSPTSESYDPEKLAVINIPVFKTHSIYAITASVKNHMGVVTQSRGTDSHSAVARGGMGSVLAEVRMPDLTILDCIWILARPGEGPSASYEDATRRDQLVASTDPIALDAWATKHIMIRAIIENGYSSDDYYDTQDPDNPDGVFRRYLDRSMNELLLAGIDTTNDPDAVDLHVWPDSDADGIPDDGNLSRTAGDSPCASGETEGCDDNCRWVPNPLQADADTNGLGDACQCGDVNGDGYTNVSDALAIARGQVLSDDPHYGKGDCNGDGFCNVSDALMIARGQQGSAPEDQLCPAYQGQ